MDQRPTADPAAIPSAGTTANIYLYLVVFAVASVLLMLVFLVWGLKARDHFGSFPLNGDTDFYRDFAGHALPEIQDQELF